jgi:hypothetical protein
MRAKLLTLGAQIDGAKTLDEVSKFIRRFALLSNEQAIVVTLWAAHTHAFGAAEHTPYLSISSPTKRTGKSRLLEVLEVLVAKPWLTGRVSAAVLPRKIEADAPTLLLDECDTALNTKEEGYGEALRGILNSGHHHRGKSSVNVKANGDWVAHDFPTFCPKAIAGIGKLPDTVADRSILIHMKRKTKGECVERFRLRNEQVKTEAATLQEALAAWCAVHIEELTEAYPKLPDALNDRQQNGAEPLLAIADLAGGDNWPVTSRAALVQLCGEAEAADDSTGVLLLRGIRTVFQSQGVDRIGSADLAEALANIEESPWGAWNRGKPITAAKLARMLSPFGITSGDIRFSNSVKKGYLIEDFEDSWNRYLPTTPDPPSQKRNNATSRINIDENADFESATDPPCSASENSEIPNTGAGCSGVAFLKPEDKKKKEPKKGSEEEF